MLMVGVLALCGAGSLMAAENKFNENEAKTIESQLFIEADESIASDNAKLSEILLSDNDSQSKCWFWGWRSWYTPCYYYYYDWYCDWYYVPVRLVYYTVPVRPVVTVTPAVTTSTVTYSYSNPTSITTTAAVTETETVASTSTTIIAKSSNKLARGVVIDKKVPVTSPLHKMGLRAGDVIAKIDGKPVTSMIDVRRMTKNSKVVFVRGDQIKVAGRQPLTKTKTTLGKSSGMNSNDIDLEALKKAQTKTMSLYEYYDSLEK